MRGAILSSLWQPRRQFVERELCEQTGADRSSVREALRVLESEGLVTVFAEQGSVRHQIVGSRCQ
jgi:DNA-binding GntR family transcriptional regulator